MKSTLLSASVLALAALASSSSFAEGNFNGKDAVSPAGALSRADVQADLAQAKRDGFDVTIGKHYLSAISAPVAGKVTRADVRAELLAYRGNTGLGAASDLYIGQ